MADESGTAGRPLEGLTFVVTGAARGIGAAVARRLARDGARVVAVDRCARHAVLDYEAATRDELDSVVGSCGNGSVGLVADVGDRAGLAEALGGALRGGDGAGARLGGAVCAAGVIWGGEPLWRTPPEVWQQLARTNVEGVLNTAAVVIPSLLDAADTQHPAGAGRFVAVASASAGRGLPLMGAYAATKAAVVSLVRSMAADLGGSGVTANAVSPGSTDTEALAASADVYGLAGTEEFARHHTTGRLVQPEEVAAAVAWLCGPESSGVTGSVVAVDGGMTAT
ncbi:MAG: mycofactocin-coupled SDR family oxidoreductase [Microthrixaceae bacterium]